MNRQTPSPCLGEGVSIRVHPHGLGPMAFCPQCRGTMGDRDIACAHCGYDFPPPPERPAQFSILSLLVATVGAASSLTAIHHLGLDGVGLSFMFLACTLLAMQQKWALPAREDWGDWLVWAVAWGVPLGCVIFMLGVPGMILVSMLMFAWLFFRRWD